MYGYRLINSQLLWDATDTPWPHFGSGQHIWFRNNNTFAVNSGGVTADYFFEIDNSVLADFCVIEVAGKIASITTVATPAGSSTCRGAVLGLPNVGPELEADPLFATHPCTTITGTISTNKFAAIASSGLGMTTAQTNALPPFYGYTSNAAWDVAVLSSWPFHAQPIVVDEAFHHVWQIGAVGPGGLGVSAFRKLYWSFKSINPAIVGGSPSALGITGKVYAHLYEFRENR